MIIVCLVSIFINGTPEDRIMSGDLVQELPYAYIVNFTHASDSIEGVTGNYENVRVYKDDCSVRKIK